MLDSLPPEVIVIESHNGVQYRFPPRSPRIRSRGWLLAAPCLILTAGVFVFLCFAAWAIFQGPVDQAFAWLFGVMVVLPLLRLVFHGGKIGLLLARGHSEVGLRSGQLYAVERWGWLCIKWERSAADLRRLFLSPKHGPFDFPGLLPRDREETWVILPEWRAAVGKENKLGWLAACYPRAWLEPVAADLSRRCAVTETAVPVAEISSAGVENVSLTEQPLGSTIKVENVSDGVTLIIPPLRIGIGAVGCFLGLNLFLGVWIWGVSTNIFGPAGVDWMAAVGTGVGVGALLAFWVAALAQFRAWTVLAVVGDSLLVRQKNLFGVKNREWSRSQVADVYVRHIAGDNDSPDQWDLRILPHPGEGTEFGLLSNRDAAELRWLATTLRASLWLPVQGPNAQVAYAVHPSIPGLFSTGPAAQATVAHGFHGRAEQPEGSLVLREELSHAGVRLTVPRLGMFRTSGGVLFFIGVALLAAASVALVLGLRGFFPLFGDLGWIITLVIIGVAICGVAGIVDGLQLALARAVLTADAQSLEVTASGLFGTKHHHWPREKVTTVNVGQHPGGGGMIWELQIHVKYQKHVGLLPGRDAGELQWIATVLREALGIQDQPATDHGSSSATGSVATVCPSNTSGTDCPTV